MVYYPFSELEFEAYEIQYHLLTIAYFDLVSMTYYSIDQYLHLHFALQPVQSY